MLFNSFIFILLFLPICLIGYFGLNHYRKYKAAKAFLLGMSLWFYGYFQIYYLLILVGSIFVNYGLYRIIRARQDAEDPEAGMKASCRRPARKWMIAGPIVTHQELVPQFQAEENKHLRIDNFSAGCVSFILGLAQKVLLADVLALAVTYGYNNIYALNTSSAFIVMLVFYFQIYFDFSGYSDMAIGLGKMLNLELPVNFDSPYKGKNVREFWKRWHMTLTRFFTRYVYIPLGGNRNCSLQNAGEADTGSV